MELYLRLWNPFKNRFFFQQEPIFYSRFFWRFDFGFQENKFQNPSNQINEWSLCSWKLMLDKKLKQKCYWHRRSCTDLNTSTFVRRVWVLRLLEPTCNGRFRTFLCPDLCMDICIRIIARNLKGQKDFLHFISSEQKRVSTLTIAGWSGSGSRSGRMSHGSREKDGKNESDNCHHHHWSPCNLHLNILSILSLSL